MRNAATKSGHALPRFWGYATQTRRSDRGALSSAVLFNSPRNALDALDSMRTVVHGRGIFEDNGDFPKIVCVREVRA